MIVAVTAIHEIDNDMSKIISINAFRRGIGKSNIIANCAALMAQQGLRVAVLDLNLPFPGIHILFGLEENVPYTLNDYCRGKCDITQTAYDVTDVCGANVSGNVFVCPMSIRTGSGFSAWVGYDIGMMIDGFHTLVDELKLDILLLDTQPGPTEELPFYTAVCDVCSVIMRPNALDYQGTGFLIEVARKMDCPRISIIMNYVPIILNHQNTKEQIEKVYDCSVAGILPFSDEMLLLGSRGLFVTKYPDHPMTQALRQIAKSLVG